MNALVITKTCPLSLRERAGVRVISLLALEASHA
jgi:hypothetical protein